MTGIFFQGSEGYFLRKFLFVSESGGNRFPYKPLINTFLNKEYTYSKNIYLNLSLKNCFICFSLIKSFVR